MGEGYTSHSRIGFGWYNLHLYKYLRYINISYYLKVQIPMCHRQFFRVISQNGESVEKFCKDVENPFHFACQKWFSLLNSKLFAIF